MSPIYLAEQRWSHVLFASWPVPASAVRGLVLPGLDIDLFDGSAWVSVVPFAVSDSRMMFLPPLPLLSSFQEVNLRTYVRYRGEPGVFFLSIDMDSLPAVLVARLTENVPFYRAQVRIAQEGETWTWQSRRTLTLGPGARFSARCQPRGEGFQAQAGSLAAFLTQRFTFFCRGRLGGVHRVQAEHAPWPLQDADGEVTDHSVAAACGVQLSGAPVLYFSPGVQARGLPLWPTSRDRR